MRLKLFHGKSLNSSLVHKIYAWPNFHESLKGSPQKFRHVRRKILTKSWYLIIQKFFKTRTFPKHKVPLRIFSVLWDKKDRQNSDTLLRKNFLIPEPFWNTEGFAHVVFWRLGTKKLRQKNVRPPLSYPWTFSLLELFWKTKAFPHEDFGFMRLNIRQNRDTPIIQDILIPEYFWNTERFAHDDFWRCETKKSTKSWYPYYPKKFCCQNISEEQKVSPTMFFGDLGQKNFDAKLWHSLLLHNFFRY